MHTVPGFVDQPGHGGKGHLLRHRQHQRLEQQGEAGQLAEPVGLDLHDPPVGQLHPRGPHLQVAFVLEEIEVPQSLDLRVMDRVRAVDTRRWKSRPGDKVNADRQHLSRRIKIDDPDVPRFANPERCFKQLVLHIRGRLLPRLNAGSCRHSALLDCRVTRARSRVRLRRASPALDRARGTPQPTHFSKEALGPVVK